MNNKKEAIFYLEGALARIKEDEYKKGLSDTIQAKIHIELIIESNHKHKSNMQPDDVLYAKNEREKEDLEEFL